MTDIVKKQAPIIWEAVNKSSKILLHFHPSPDPDTVGAGLALMHIFERLGKAVTILQGDSQFPESMKSLPGVDKILAKNYLEINPEYYDLFIINDSSNLDQVSKKGEVKFPEGMTTVVIDHHISNLGYGKINLIDDTYPATCQIVYDLLTCWGVEISKEAAVCLFLGIYADTGGFKYPKTSPETFRAAAHLAEINPDFSKVVFDFENTNSEESLKFVGLALSSIRTYFDSQVAISEVPFEKISALGIDKKDTERSQIANALKTVVGWNLCISFFEVEKDQVNVSFRTRDTAKFDVSKIASALGGGGHAAAGGATIKEPFEQAKDLLMRKIEEIYPSLGEP